MDVPGASPTSPVITVAPVLVIADPASTAYGVAEPRLRLVAANAFVVVNILSDTKPKRLSAHAARPIRDREFR